MLVVDLPTDRSHDSSARRLAIDSASVPPTLVVFKGSAIVSSLVVVCPLVGQMGRVYVAVDLALSEMSTLADLRPPARRRGLDGCTAPALFVNSAGVAIILVNTPRVLALAQRHGAQQVDSALACSCGTRRVEGRAR